VKLGWNFSFLYSSNRQQSGARTRLLYNPENKAGLVSEQRYIRMGSLYRRGLTAFRSNTSGTLHLLVNSD
jgi:hypothetical protein